MKPVGVCFNGPPALGVGTTRYKRAARERTKRYRLRHQIRDAVRLPCKTFRPDGVDMCETCHIRPATIEFSGGFGGTDKDGELMCSECFTK